MGAGAGGRCCQKALREDWVRGWEEVDVEGEDADWMGEGLGRGGTLGVGERAAAKRMEYVFSGQLS